MGKQEKEDGGEVNRAQTARGGGDGDGGGRRDVEAVAVAICGLRAVARRRAKGARAL
jgi:hypothetical protein